MKDYANETGRKTYRYTVYGISIESELMLPELNMTDNSVTDVKIEIGNVTDKLAVEIPDTGSYCYSQSGEFIYCVEGIGAYLVSGGSRITVQPYRQADGNMVKLFLLGTIMGVLLMQRGLAVLHGSSVLINGQGVLFTGLSGAGKSTMAAALHRRGYCLMADDVSPLQRDEQGQFWIQPGYPQQKLWQESAELVGINTENLEVVSDVWKKFALPLKEGFHATAVPLAAVYEIVARQGGDIEIRPLRGAAKMSMIMENTYRCELMDCLGLRIQHFEQCGAIARQLPVFQLSRPEKVDSLQKQVEAVVSHLTQLDAKQA
ncbi:hypothetical protein [Azotosporobacter soli]|uniref:hypothetical protein n=1 Tax=Azotosporobacter soli TaxID=3055040 RepID=UPI0031FEBF3F